MNHSSPPVEQQRFARTQTPESPRPVHVPEPSSIPVLLNQMDPVFNDTETYNIPSDQTFSPYAASLEQPAPQASSLDDQDAVQSFFREAENQATAEPIVPEVSPSDQPSIITNTNLDASSQPPDDAHPNHDPPPSAQQLQMNSIIQNMAAAAAAAAAATSTAPADTNEPLQPAQDNSADPNHATAPQPANGIDYQSLLDNIAQSSSIAPSAGSVAAPTTAVLSSDQKQTSLPAFAGLPPKPPSLDTNQSLSINANYSQFLSANDSLASGQSLDTNYNQPPPSVVDPSPSLSATLDSNLVVYDQAPPSGTAPAVYAKAPGQPFHDVEHTDPNADEVADRPWSPKTQSVYDLFLEDERRYVTEGIWDRFPNGSRLFVGNLPSEKVTKRDLFHKFHRHGKLAQISIKQAYGFVQYHDIESCSRALNAEQSTEIRGRKVHLEVSKPQKNTKGAGASKPQPAPRRRSRSPDRRRYSDYRDEPGRSRDQYRRRSPSPPRRLGSREDYSRMSSRDDRRSPAYGAPYGTSQPPTFDDESSLPFPRRDPRNVPDVQLIVMDAGVQQGFINWVEDGFRRQGIQAQTSWINHRVSLQALIKRQIIEGVQAIVKLDSNVQARTRIPLQVFDRSQGARNVNFNEYADLDVNVAADLVAAARQRERGSYSVSRPPQSQPTPQQYQPTPQQPFYGASPPPLPIHHSQPPPQYAPRPPGGHFAPLSQPQYQNYPPPPQPQQQQQQQPQNVGAQSSNLQALLANLKGGASQPQSAQSTSPPQALYQQGFAQPQQYQQQQNGTTPQSVLDVMAGLARYQR